MMNAFRTFLLHHLPWLIFVIVAAIGIHEYNVEHNQRAIAEKQVAVDEQTVKALQTQIATTNQQIATLQQSMQAVSLAAQKQIQVVVKQQEAVKTPQEAIPAISSLVPALDAKTETDDATRASVLALPLFQTLSQAKIDSINLDACNQNLVSETTIANNNGKNYTSEVAIVAQKDDEIKVLTKKPKFWHRVGSTMKKVGIGVAIGALLVAVH